MYVKRHDGEAATTEDFVTAIVEGACSDGQDLALIPINSRRWYHQAGTPRSRSARNGMERRELTLTLEQITAPTPGQPDKLPLVIPVLWPALQPDGRPGQERLLVLDQQRQTLVVEGQPPAATPLFSRCSAIFLRRCTWDAGQSAG